MSSRRLVWVGNGTYLGLDNKSDGGRAQPWKEKEQLEKEKEKLREKEEETREDELRLAYAQLVMAAPGEQEI